MTNDEHTQEDGQEAEDTTTEQTTDTGDSEGESEGDNGDQSYRAKLNAQNRFLEKEGYVFKDGKWTKPPATTQESNAATKAELTPADALALAKANVHDDDLDTILEWAAFKKIPVKDALSDATLKTTLSVRAEERRTAEATQTGNQSRGVRAPSGEALLQKAEQTGEVPDTDEGLDALIDARMARKGGKK